MRLGEVVARELALAAEDDPRIWVIDGDLGDSYGVDELAPRLGRRHVQAGIAEQAMVSLAAGLAAEGQRPWVFSFAAFLCGRAYDQLRVCVAQTRLPVVLIGSHAGGCAGPNGKTHALTSDVALMSTLPDLAIWAPADPRETRAVVRQIAASDRAAYVRLPRDPQSEVDWQDDAGSVCKRLGSPARVAVVSTGLGTRWALHVRAVLRARDLELPVVHVPLVEPFPAEQVAAAIRGASRLIAIEDHAAAGGLADILRRTYPDRSVRAIGWPRGWHGASGDAEQVRGSVGLDDQALTAACLTELEQAGRR